MKSVARLERDDKHERKNKERNGKRRCQIQVSKQAVVPPISVNNRNRDTQFQKSSKIHTVNPSQPHHSGAIPAEKRTI